MSESDIARIFWGTMVFLAITLLGDYLGHRMGGRRLAMWLGIIALVTVIAFAIYAGVKALAPR